ncbi:ARF GTPase-activating protein Git [Anthonomus grandis grandis]|uniref:ARF GTPase-activating protein Git n=1 Tax=Anthonomus grandis grandis TaxID=2921223 RepID=UPI0021654F85|nr:ARF GTPase-activating protein Git [Anthonomus grandis grandis]
MSRTKSRQNVEVCGDCGAADATWASLNKGILLCTQCCSVHRSLGRHISQVKSILKTTWNHNQLNMVTTLNNNGANNIWEHTLLENGGKLLKKKPSSKDPISVKQEYIKCKHQLCQFAFRENYEDGLLSVENELGKQLHASVRTPNLETSFRLLALGADPNYFHDEKGSTPLHVAVNFDQKLQVELLLVYGADPTCPDNQGRTPLDYARQSNNKEVMSRLIESQYEVTDTFSYYLSLRKPDHNKGVHFLIPPVGFKSVPASLAKLRKLPNHVFEELVMDVYDEVDRRQTESIWLSCADTTDLNDVPFLPVDNTLTTTRNQGRQKLARFTTPELKSLVYDILVDTQRRQNPHKSGSTQLRETSEIDDDDPLYDSVAEDEDYAVPIEKDEEAAPTTSSNKDSIISIDSINKTNQVLEQLTKQLKHSDGTITELRAEVAKLRQSVKTLQGENFELRRRLASSHKGTGFVNGDNGFDSLEFINEHTELSQELPNGSKAVDEVDLRQKKAQLRPTSMYEPREGINKLANWQALKAQLKQNESSSARDRETVLQCTEQITRTIQRLCKAIQEPEKGECVSSGEKVKLAIAVLASTLPKVTQECEGEKVKQMLEVANRLQPECMGLQISRLKGETKSVDAHFSNIRDIAFNLAKFTKEIVTKYSASP